MCFFLGVSLNVIGATTSLMATSSLPSPTELQEALSAYQGAIVEVESISEAMGAVTLASGPMVCLRVFKLTCAQLNGQAIHQLVNDQLRAWKRAHHLHITNLLITGNLIAQWNIQRFVYALVMLTSCVILPWTHLLHNRHATCCGVGHNTAHISHILLYDPGSQGSVFP